MYFIREIKRLIDRIFIEMTEEDRNVSDPHLLTSLDSFEELLDRSEREPVILFKHSTMCGTSSLAKRRLDQLEPGIDPPVFMLVIQSYRMLSNHVAHHFQIRHESPQIIVIYKKQPVYDASHTRISSETIREAVASLLLP